MTDNCLFSNFISNSRYYKNGDSWKEVETNDQYGVEKDKYNVVNFKPVKTTGLKISAQLQKGASGGIIEWKVE